MLFCKLAIVSVGVLGNRFAIDVGNARSGSAAMSGNTPVLKRAIRASTVSFIVGITTPLSKCSSVSKLVLSMSFVKRTMRDMYFSTICYSVRALAFERNP